MADSAITAAVMGLVGTCVGALLTTGVTFFNAHRQRRSEIDARVVSAAFNFAALEWRGHFDGAMHSGRGAVLPPTVYLAHALSIARLVNENREINVDDLVAIQLRSDKLAREFAKIDERSRSDKSDLPR